MNNKENKIIYYIQSLGFAKFNDIEYLNWLIDNEEGEISFKFQNYYDLYISVSDSNMLYFEIYKYDSLIIDDYIMLDDYWKESILNFISRDVELFIEIRNNTLNNILKCLKEKK